MIGQLTVTIYSLRPDAGAARVEAVILGETPSTDPAWRDKQHRQLRDARTAVVENWAGIVGAVLHVQLAHGLGRTRRVYEIRRPMGLDEAIAELLETHCYRENAPIDYHIQMGAVPDAWRASRYAKAWGVLWYHRERLRRQAEIDAEKRRWAEAFELGER